MFFKYSKTPLTQSREHRVTSPFLFFEQACVQQLPTPADNVTLLAVAAERRPCSNRSIFRGRRAHSSKPAARCCSG